MPFARAAQMLEEFLGIQVSEATARRLTEHAGVLYEARQTTCSQQKSAGVPTQAICAKQAISADGSYVPLLHGQWAEVRTVVIGEVKEEAKARKQSQVHVRHL